MPLREAATELLQNACERGLSALLLVPLREAGTELLQNACERGLSALLLVGTSNSY
jgi:hypothetical protein